MHNQGFGIGRAAVNPGGSVQHPAIQPRLSLEQSFQIGRGNQAMGRRGQFAGECGEQVMGERGVVAEAE